MSRGQSLELFFIDGKPDGMLTAEVFNWTGHVLMTPRTQLSEALKRVQSSYTGVYLLFGEKDGDALAYIGEGEDISERIRNHDTRKDWWTTAIFIVSKDNNLNKAHVRYLEARLIEAARSVGRIHLENGTTPAKPSLSESAQADMETFLDNILMILPALRIDSFIEKKRSLASDKALSSDLEDKGTIFEMFLRKDNIHATATLINGEFVVAADSKARKDWVGDRKEKTYYWKIFDELVDQGILVDQGHHRVFKTDYAFTSTSAAGAVVSGRSTSGPMSWKLKGTDKTYRDWEIDKLASQKIDS